MKLLDDGHLRHISQKKQRFESLLGELVPP